jgi:hypothetical protein
MHGTATTVNRRALPQTYNRAIARRANFQLYACLCTLIRFVSMPCRRRTIDACQVLELSVVDATGCNKASCYRAAGARCSKIKSCFCPLWSLLVVLGRWRAVITNTARNVLSPDFLARSDFTRHNLYTAQLPHRAQTTTSTQSSNGNKASATPQPLIRAPSHLSSTAKRTTATASAAVDHAGADRGCEGDAAAEPQQLYARYILSIYSVSILYYMHVNWSTQA